MTSDKDVIDDLIKELNAICRKMKYAKSYKELADLDSEFMAKAEELSTAIGIAGTQMESVDPEEEERLANERYGWNKPAFDF